MLSGSFFIGNCQMYALRGLKQGNPKTSLTSMGNNYRPIQPTHYRPVRTNIDFTSTEVIDYIAEQSTSLSLYLSLSLRVSLSLTLSPSLTPLCRSFKNKWRKSHPTVPDMTSTGSGYRISSSSSFRRIQIVSYSPSY